MQVYTSEIEQFDYDYIISKIYIFLDSAWSGDKTIMAPFMIFYLENASFLSIKHC